MYMTFAMFILTVSEITTNTDACVACVVTRLDKRVWVGAVVPIPAACWPKAASFLVRGVQEAPVVDEFAITPLPEVAVAWRRPSALRFRLRVQVWLRLRLRFLFFAAS